MKHDMRKVVTKDLLGLASQIQKLVLSPHGGEFGWWKIGEDIAKNDQNPRRSLHFSDQSGKRLWGHRFQFPHPNGKVNDGHEITFTNLRVASIESMELGDIEVTPTGKEFTQTIEYENHGEAFPFSVELERSSEKEVTLTSEKEAEFGFKQALEVSVSYLSVEATASTEFEQKLRQRKEEQKRNLEALRNLQNPEYMIPANKRWRLVRKTGTATVRQPIIVRGRLNFDLKLWSHKHKAGTLLFYSYDDFLDQASGLAAKETHFCRFFNQQARGLSQAALDQFARPIVTLKIDTENDASVYDKRVITVEPLK